MGTSINDDESIIIAVLLYINYAQFIELGYFFYPRNNGNKFVMDMWNKCDLGQWV